MKESFLFNRESLVRRAAVLRLTARTLAESMRNGSFRSLYRGQGIEFNGVREYLPGDDIRTIDWNVTARMDKPFVKLFEEEQELPVFFVVDRSFSMNTGSSGRSRLALGGEIGALLTLAAEQNASPVGAVFFDGKIGFSCAPKRGREQSMLLLTRFEEIPGDSIPGSVLQKALAGAGRLLRSRCLIFVISDFRIGGWQLPFGRLAEKNDVVAIRIADPQDEYLPDGGSVSFTDIETDKTFLLPTSSAAFRAAWHNDNRSRLEKWKKDCLSHSGYPLVISTEEDPVAVLTRFFMHREHIQV